MLSLFPSHPVCNRCVVLLGQFRRLSSALGQNSPVPLSPSSPPKTTPPSSPPKTTPPSSPTPSPPAQTGHACLSNRHLISLTGPDSAHFLHGLTTTTIPTAPHPAGLYSAFLTAAGRVLYDVFIYTLPAASSALPSSGRDDSIGGFLIEVDRREAQHLAAHLRRYKLRARVKIRVLEDGEAEVWSAWAPSLNNPLLTVPGAANQTHNHNFGGVAAEPRIVSGCADVRAPGMGLRLVLPRDAKPLPAFLAKRFGKECSDAMYAVRRIMSGVAEGQGEMVREVALPLESNLDLMGGVDFRKGCYVGQELTIRTRHTGVVRKRILPVVVWGVGGDAESGGGDNGKGGVGGLEYLPDYRGRLPEPGAEIRRADTGRKRVGKWLGGVGNVGLALWRLEAGFGGEGGVAGGGGGRGADIGEGGNVKQMRAVKGAGETAVARGGRRAAEGEFRVAVPGGGELGIRAFVPDWHWERGGMK